MSDTIRELIGQRIRAMVDGEGVNKAEAPPKRPPTLLKIPLEDIDEEGLNLSISMTGTHLCIKI